MDPLPKGHSTSFPPLPGPLEAAEPSHPVLPPKDGRKDELVPLPTDLDPEKVDPPIYHDDEEGVNPPLTTETQKEIIGEQESGDADLLTGTEEPDEGQEGAVAEEADISQVEQNAEGAETEEEVEQVEEREEVQDPVLKNILMSLQASRGEEDQEEKEEREQEQEPETTFSSPLSDLPELPNEFRPSPEPPSPPPRPRTPPPPTIVATKQPSPPISRATPAESSTTAVERLHTPSTRSPSISASYIPPVPPVKRPRETQVNGKATAVKKPRSKIAKGKTPIRVDSDMEVDDLKSINDVKEEGEGVSENEEGDIDSEATEEGGKKKYKRQKGPDGRTVRTSAKSRKMLDQVLGIGRNGETPPEKIAPRAKPLTDIQLAKVLKGKTTEIQMASCLRSRYAKWGKCTQCVGKIGGDSCRFRDYRVFKIDPNTIEIQGPGWFESTEWKDEITELPRQFNVPLTEVHMERIEQTVAPLLLPLITREIRHVVNHKAIKRGTDAAKHRAVCDFCSSTIFAGWFFCKKCGRDYCLVCERYFSDSHEKMGESPWHLPDAARPRLLRCVIQQDLAPDGLTQKANGKQPVFHVRSDLQPVSRFSEEELRDHWLALAEFVLHSTGGVGERLKLLGLSAASDDVVEQMQDWVSALPSPSPLVKPVLEEEEVKKLYTKITIPDVEIIPDPAGLQEHNREFIFIEDEQLTLGVFDQLLVKGEPIVVDKVGENLKMSWTPDDFVDRFGDEMCIIVDCQTNQSKPQTIERFFEMFKARDNRAKAILKLKDWPQTDDFANTHPDLYNDFCDALPVPDFTRREGVLNLYAHFPPGPTRPDIGPKMYNAFEAVESAGGFGSTRLHMDVADAVNVMLYASPRKDGQPGCAVWDLFRAEDADKIRLYLKKKYDKTHKFTDPIHSQLFYLDSKLRKELWEKHGVISWRVYQYPGQAVFIPAGCAHQVCNLADCIKIALDFISTHNVSRCQQLTQDFRTENFVKAWKDDVLQLYNVLWYAWTNVHETRERRIREDQAHEEEARLRAARLASLQNGVHHPTTPFTSHLGLRHHSNGILSPIVSSVRDEENTRRSPSVPHSPHSRQTSTYPPPQTLAAVEEPQAGTDASISRIYAEKLLGETLAASEPPPPPEARAPSAATKWTARISIKPPSIPVNLRREDGGRSTRGTTSQLIEIGALPTDLAVSAARSHMGGGVQNEQVKQDEPGRQGAPEDQEKQGDREGKQGQEGQEKQEGEQVEGSSVGKGIELNMEPDGKRGTEYSGAAVHVPETSMDVDPSEVGDGVV